MSKDMMEQNDHHHQQYNEDPTPLSSLFNKIKSEKEKRCLSIPHHINEKRYFLKSFLLQRFPKNKKKQKPFVVEQLEYALMNKFFEDKDDPYYVNPMFLYESRRPVSQNYRAKINIGSLTYLSLKELEPSMEKRKFLNQKDYLMTSQNFHIGKEYCINSELSPTRSIRKSPHMKRSSCSVYLDSKNQQSIENNSIIPTEISSFPLQSLNNTTLKPIIKQRTSSNKKNYSHNVSKRLFTVSNNDPIASRLSFRIHTQQNKSNKIPRKTIIKCKKDFFNKINKLSLNRSKNEKKLFKIIDKSQRKPESINQQIRTDLEEIFDIHLKKKATQGETKKAIMQALKLNKMKPLAMDETKMKMLELSDRINKLTDEEALLYAERIAEEYNKNNILLSNDGYNITSVKRFDSKMKNEINNKKRLESNYIKIACLSNSLIQKNRQMKKENEEKKQMILIRKLNEQKKKMCKK